MGVNSLPKTVARQRRDCDSNPGPSAPESSTLTTRPPSHPIARHRCVTAMEVWCRLRVRSSSVRIDERVSLRGYVLAESRSLRRRRGSRSDMLLALIRRAK